MGQLGQLTLPSKINRVLSFFLSFFGVAVSVIPESGLMLNFQQHPFFGVEAFK